MKIKILLFFIMAVALFSCNQEKTSGGLAFTRLKKGDGKIVEPNHFMLIDLVIKSEKDSVWLDSRVKKRPMLVKIDAENPKKKEEGEEGVFRLLSKGDSVTFVVDAATVFEKTRNMAIPKHIDRSTKVTYHVIVLEIFDEAQLKAYQQKEVEKQERERTDFRIKQFGIDTVLIDDFLKTKGIKARKTSSGIRFTVQKEGIGAPIAVGRKAHVLYTGYMLDGRVFDSNVKSGQPLPVDVGRGAVIRGWDEMLQIMKKGSKYTVYIPSMFGYGERGYEPDIPANSVLIFEMEVVEIK